MPRKIERAIDQHPVRPAPPIKPSGASRWDLLAVLGLACLLSAAACRANLPPPPPEGSGGTAGSPRGGGSGGGTGGVTGKADGNAGNGGSDAMTLETGPSCGEPKMACCPGNRCLNGGCCERGVCTSYGDVCKLSPGSSCLGGTCSNECGGVVNGASMKCCSMNNCTAALTVCDSAGPAVGLCVGCGKPGQPCCSDNNGVNNYCEGGAACTAGKCPGGTIDAGTPADTGGPISADSGSDGSRG